MTKNIRTLILERDQMYAEYVKEISRLYGGKLSNSIGTVIFNGRDTNSILEDINIVLQNTNYVSVVLLATRAPDGVESDQPIPTSTISFAIPLDILEKGTEADITEYLLALKEDQEARGQPVPIDGGDTDYVRKILDRVKRNAKDDAMQLGDTDELELDEIQKSLARFAELNETKH